MSSPFAQPASQRPTLLVGLSALALVLVALTARFIVPTSLLQLGVLAVFAGVAGLAVFVYPKLGLWAAVFYIYASLSWVIGFSLSHLITLVVAAGVCMQLARGDAIRLRDPWFNWTVVLFTLISIQSMLLSHSFALSTHALGQWLKALIIIYLVVQLVHGVRDLERLAMAAVVGTVASIVIGALFITTGNLEDISYRPVAGLIRFQGTHDNSNNAALYFATTIPLGVYFIKRGARTLWRVAAAGATLIMFLGIIATLSRQAVFPLSIVALGVFLREARSRKVYVTTFLFVFAGITLAPGFYWYRLASIADVLSSAGTQDFSLYLRLTALRTAWELFMEHPFLGVGLNNFPLRSGYELFVRIPAHNAYLDVLVGVGLLGFAVFTAMHIAVLRATRCALRRSPRRGRLNDLVYYFLLAYLTGMVGSLFQSIPYYYLIWIPAAAVLAAATLRTGPPLPENSSHG